MTPEYVGNQWVWLTDEGMKPLTPHEIELLNEGVFHDE